MQLEVESTTEQTKNNTSENTHVRVNGTEIPIRPNGLSESTINTSSGDILVNVQNESTSTQNETSTSIDLSIESQQESESTDQ